MPPKKTEDITSILERKFDELKEVFFADVRVNLLEEFKCIMKDEMKAFVESQNKKVLELESSVAILQEHVSYLKEQNNTLVGKCDDNEQYGRRLCLRISGIPIVENETAECVFDKVNELIKEEKCDIPINMVDRAHRIGKVYTDEDSKKEKQDVIVRFTTFRHRTLFYKSRKSFKSDVKVRLDLTKSRYSVLRDARNLVEREAMIKFVYADINCNLKVHPAVGTDKFFNSIDELKYIISNL